MATDHPTLSVVAPCFNEEGVLHELYRRISQVLDGSGESWELVSGERWQPRPYAGDHA